MAQSHWRHYVRVAGSVLLLVSAVFELSDTVIEEMIGANIEALHGLIIYALAKVVTEATELRAKLAEAREAFIEARHAPRT